MIWARKFLNSTIVVKCEIWTVQIKDSTIVKFVILGPRSSDSTIVESVVSPFFDVIYLFDSCFSFLIYWKNKSPNQISLLTGSFSEQGRYKAWGNKLVQDRYFYYIWLSTIHFHTFQRLQEYSSCQMWSRIFVLQRIFSLKYIHYCLLNLHLTMFLSCLGSNRSIFALGESRVSILFLRFPGAERATNRKLLFW